MAGQLGIEWKRRSRLRVGALLCLALIAMPTMAGAGDRGTKGWPMFRGNAARTGCYPFGLGKRKRGEKKQAIVFVGSGDHNLY
ncbi:MAG: hypothetical protein IID41_02785, partial [Planctomycetes bacterium]|nr:hypothetical protein [Planctomycetota bacterium]